MRKYVIATHGKMAEGIRSTLEIIVGPQENLICINGYTEEFPEPVSEMKRIVEENQEDEVVFMTDLLGGSINNNAVSLMDQEKVYVVTGINLAAVISLVMSDPDQDTAEAVREAVESSREMMVYCNEMKQEGDLEEDF